MAHMHRARTTWWFVLVALIVGVLAGFAASPRANADRLDYQYFLRQLTDLEALPKLQPGVTCKQFSSYDRRSHQPDGWAANGDRGQYLRAEPDTGEAVMAEMDGPGCIFRIWSANPQGLIRFYLDGDPQPTFEWDFNALFSGEIDPFLPRFVYKRGDQQSASDCYLPIPYAKSCKVTADKAHGQYYHIGYKTYLPGTEVETFHLPLTQEERGALDEVRKALDECGQDPKRPSDPVQSRAADANTGDWEDTTLRPGQRVAIADLEGPGTIQSLRVKIEGLERYAWHKTVISAYWDGETDPSIHTPLAAFFGTGWQANPYKSLPLGIDDSGWGYCYFAMPFRESARIALTNMGRQDVRFSYQVTWTKEPVPDEEAQFHARWRREAPCETFDYPLIEAQGQGHFVGVVLNVDYPNPHWWGEGDEKVWVDGEEWPSTFGTGSEDYFGDAWGIRAVHEPFFACSWIQPPRVSCYRWHVPDDIPFQKSLRMTIENYPDFPEDYASCAFWYQTEPHARTFSILTPELLRTWGKSMPWTVEVEDIFPALSVVHQIPDTLLPTELSREDARRPDVSPDRPLKGDLHVERENVYYLTLWGLAGRPSPPLELAIDGALVPGSPQTTGDEGRAVFGGVELLAGDHDIEIRFAEAAVSVVLDCLQLEPASRVRDAIEAEDIEPGGSSGQPVSVETATLRWSGGQQLVFAAEGPGNYIDLAIPTRARGRFELVAHLTSGPDHGTVQAYQRGKPIGAAVSAFAPEFRPGPQRSLGQVELTDEDRAVRLQVVGKDEQSSGYRFGIDYFLLQPITIENAIEGEHAKVLDSKGAGVTVQQMSYGRQAWSGGAQLWLPSHEPEGFVTIEAEVPQDGKYQLAVYLTTARDYALCQVLVDGKQVGEPVDCYTPGVEWKGKTGLGVVELKAGRHEIRFQSVGKNEQSVGYMIGVDCYTLQPIK